MSTEILAPLPGKIIRMGIAAQSSVQEDSEILIIEAMKMETPVYSPCEGIIEKILKKEGDDVEQDDVIAIIA